MEWQAQHWYIVVGLTLLAIAWVRKTERGRQ